jgi:hypothetical protein
MIAAPISSANVLPPDIAKAIDYHYELRDRLLYEAAISARLLEGMKRFAARAMLRHPDKEAWLEETDVEVHLRSIRITLENTVHMAFRLMERRIEETEKIEREAHIWLLLNQAQAESNLEKNNVAVLNEDHKPIAFTHNPQNPGYALRVPHKDEPDFCEHCHVIGHLTVHCKVLYPDEEDVESACAHCKLEGHHVNECWTLHPELRGEHVQQLNKSREKACEECGAKGRARSYCWKLHKQPDVPAQVPESSHEGQILGGGTENLLPTTYKFNYWVPQPALQFSAEEVAAAQAVQASKPDFDAPVTKHCDVCDEPGHKAGDCPKLQISSIRVDTDLNKPAFVKVERVRKFAKAIR